MPHDARPHDADHRATMPPGAGHDGVELSSTAAAPVVDSSTSGEMIAEKRRFQRYESPYSVDMLDARKRTADGAIRLLDMSAVGVGIESTQELAVGQRLGFNMSMDDGFPLASLQATARVRWSQPWGFTNAYGLEIEGLGRLHTQVTLIAGPVGSIPTSRLPPVNVHNFSDDRQQPSHQSVHTFYRRIHQTSITTFREWMGVEPTAAR